MTVFQVEGHGQDHMVSAILQVVQSTAPSLQIWLY